jgi:heme/copper-type cytochrome/quinol oxidase subunit 2
MKKATIKNFALGAVLLLLVAAPFVVTAQGNINPGEPPIKTPGEVKTSLQNIVSWMSTIFWIVAVGYVIWAAFMFLHAGGDAEKVEAAKKRILYALIAAAVALLANGIMSIVTNVIKGQ